MKIIFGNLQFGQTTKSISGKTSGEILDEIGEFIIEKWELPQLDINRETNCFEPTGEVYYKYGATRPTGGGSRTHYFDSLGEAQIFAVCE